MTGDQDTLPLAFESPAVPVWIDAAELAELAGVTKQAIRLALSKCATGATWRKHALKVRTKDGGPASAQNPYLVHVDSLPPALAGAYYERHVKTAQDVQVLTGPTLPMPETLGTKAAMKRAVSRWRLEILLPALQWAKGGFATFVRHVAKVDNPRFLTKTGARSVILGLERWIEFDRKKEMQG